MKRMKHVKKQLIEAIFITSLVISNVVAGKILMIGPLVIPGAVLLYAITFLCTDLLSELYGKDEAIKIVRIGFIATIFAALMILLTRYLPVAPFAQATQDAYVVLLGSNIRIVLASMVAYFISQHWDVWMFHLIKEKTGVKKKWLRNNLSTMTSQLIDTSIFITIAFWGLVPNLWIMVVSQYVVKLMIAALDTPIFYFLTRKVEE